MLRALLWLFVCSSLVACDSEEAPAVAAGPAPVQAAAPTTASPPTSTPAPAPVVLLGPIGVAACDEYVDAYRRCIADVVREPDRPAHTSVLDGQRLAWAQMAADAAQSPELAGACQAARVAAKVAMPRCRSL
jgi:hypothetical protein